LTFNGLHGVISQKIVLFRNTLSCHGVTFQPFSSYPSAALSFLYKNSTKHTAVHSVVLRLGNVSLDIALEGYNPNTSKAMAVEQCQCPQPYKGLSCEDCAPGYYRSQTGPYGGYCVPCQCNGHSDTCDEVTGICHVSIFHYKIVSARCMAAYDYAQYIIIGHGERVVSMPTPSWSRLVSSFLSRAVPGLLNYARKPRQY
jgi:hypothetical protein